MFAASMPLRASAGDDTFETSFRKTYAYQTYLKDDAIRAEITNGVVTLTGTVAEKSHQTLAQAIAANLAGVVRVDNRLAIGNEAAATNRDVSIAREVNLALQFHRNVSDGRTYVTVTDGVVTLQGVASGTAQKELLAAFVADVVGVKGVKNEMTVATTLEPVVQTTGETLDDASVTAQVVTALMTHRSTSSVITRVTTRNGEVTLTGIAMNDSQNAMIVKIVTDIRGVTSVKNQMTIENEPRTN
jgi:osmotically-inducible protein OsmY